MSCCSFLGGAGERGKGGAGGWVDGCAATSVLALVLVVCSL